MGGRFAAARATRWRPPATERARPPSGARPTTATTAACACPSDRAGPRGIGDRLRRDFRCAGPGDMLRSMASPLLAPGALRTRLGAVVLLDARPGPDAYAAGHLPGAIHADL